MLIEFLASARCYVLNVHTCSLVDSDLECDINNSGDYRGDRDTSGILSITLKTEKNIQETVFIEKRFFLDVKSVNVIGNCDVRVDVESDVNVKCLKVCILFLFY